MESAAMASSRRAAMAVFLLLLVCNPFVVSVQAHATSADEVTALYSAATRGNGRLSCESKCRYRCSKASRQKLCFKDCCICCRKCGCVPPGTAGNRERCPCYANLKNSKGTGKCP